MSGSRRLVLDPPTPAPTPQPAQGNAAPGGAAAAAQGVGPQGGAPAPAGAFSHLGHNNAQHQPGLAQNQGMGYPMYAPNGHNPLVGWHPHMMGGLPGAIPHDGNQSGTGSSTAANSAGGASSSAQANYIPNYSIPNATHPIPGFIPLFPVGDEQERAGQSIWAPFGTASPSSGDAQNPPSDTNIPGASASPRTTHRVLTSERIPLTTLDTLTDDQIRYLEENTRRGLQERLRILQAVESQIAESVSVLNRILGSLPPAGTPVVPTRSTGATSSLGADLDEFADPPSPVFASAGAEVESTNTNGAAGSARNWMHGGAAGQGSASSIGLQSTARDGLERALSNMSNGTRATDSHSTRTPTSPATNGMSPHHEDTRADTPTGSPSDAVAPTFLPSPSISPLEPEAAELEEQDGSVVRLVDKGKGKKTEAELDEEALREKAGKEATDNEDEDSNYSPQEMVRRRWARMDVSPSE